MKKLIILFTLFLSINGFSQRYLTDDYLILDSTIAGIYGTSVDYQSNTQNLLFDFYEPQNDILTKRPLIIYLHGGGFTSGSRSYPSVKLLCRRMANKGYAVANIDYRLDPSFDLYNSSTDRRAMTDAMHDAKQAIRYFKANADTYKIDTSLIFIGGESAGAITSMMASFVDKQTEMSTYPMANPNNPIGSTVNPNNGNDVKATLCLCGLILDTLAIELPTDPSILWTHGTDDTFIPISLAFNIVLRATNINLPIEARSYEGGVHCPWYYGNPNWETYLDSTVTDITNFLYPMVTTNGIGEKNKNPDISIYPNPFNSKLKINANSKVSSITITSSIGAIIHKESFDSTNNEINLNLEDLEPGSYFLLIDFGTTRIVKKIIKSW